jgi:hypothetical protein
VANAALAKYAADAAAASAVLLNYHPATIIPSVLSGLLGVDVPLLTVMLSMVGADLTAAEFFQSLQGGPTASPGSPDPLITLISKVVPLTVLFGGGAYQVGDLNFIMSQAGLFAIADFNQIVIPNVRKLTSYRGFAANLLAKPQADVTPLQRVLAGFPATSHSGLAQQADLALVLDVDPNLLHALLPKLTLPATPPEALTSLAAIADLAKTLGLGVDALHQSLSDTYADQTYASNALLGAFRAQCHTAQDFTDRSKPFDDRLRARRRDALTDYLLSSSGPQFHTLDDLYSYFLLDVQLEGIMQTSWVAAAISSVQLYIYRCIMNLEQDQRDPSNPDHIAVTLGTQAATEWEWRQNYRVWQANREVFLFPESYILPELRDDKTPLFEDLESALLQQPITEESVEDAYATFMSGLDQLSKLKIAGSFHDIDQGSGTDVLHLFGVTPADPPTFFYRTIENASHGETESDQAVTYTPWAPVSLQIHCREVSPIVYLGRLFVFWNQITTASVNLVASGNSVFGGYKHTLRVKYSSLNLDQTWSPPQQISLTDTTVFPQGDGVVMDQLLDSRDKVNGYANGMATGFDEFGGFCAQENETSLVILGFLASKQSQAQSDACNRYNSWQSKIEPGFSFNLADYEATLIPLYDNRPHPAAVDGYTLTGFQWERLYPTLDRNKQNLRLSGRNFLMRGDSVNFYNQVVEPSSPLHDKAGPQTVLCSTRDNKNDVTTLQRGVQDLFSPLERYPWCAIVAKEERSHKLGETLESIDINNQGYLLPDSAQPLQRGLYKTRLATIDGDPDIDVVNSSEVDALTDAVIDADGDLLLLQGSVRPGDHVLKRLSTTLGESLCRALFVKGVDGLLDLDTQSSLREPKAPLRNQSHIQDEVVSGQMDFTGAMGTYLREIFFHAPFLIADQLSSQQNFAAALHWYQYIFDPTADDDDPNRKRKGRPERATLKHHHGEHRNETEAGWKEDLDRVWRFIEFRNLDVPRLRAILTDAAAIAAYDQNPFNPHAIARLRLSAYQKCIVMNYIDVLIAWGDSLFTEFQMETVNEATLLYVQALDILGPRPAVIGDCGEGDENQRTYAHIAPLVKNGSDFLVEMESYTHAGSGAARAQAKSRPQHQYMIEHAVAQYYFNQAVNAGRRLAEGSHAAAMTEEDHAHGAAPADAHRHALKVAAERGTAHPLHWKGKHGTARSQAGCHGHKTSRRKSPDKASGGHGSRFGASVVRHIGPAFCVPPNTDLLGYWDIVEDRLYKIRHGMDITGALRQLSLFAPPINPMMLVEATAAGLSLEDVLTTSSDFPPYRFTYLIEKARQYASQVQGFGGAVLSAIEKRDAQTLEVLRVTQQQNILAMTTSTKQSEVDAAQNAVDTLTAQLDTAQFRHDYFQGLVDSELNAWEVLEAGFRAISVKLAAAPVVQHTSAAILHLIPQLGSPFAMKYGGAELGTSMKEFGQAGVALGKGADVFASAAAVVGGWARRSEGWQHEVDMANKDIAQIATQLTGANIRLKSANKALDIHNKTIAQNQQVADFYTSRFSNVALYTWLATTMQTTHRQAYTSAYAMAKLAEQAYRFERNDDTTILLSETYWSQAQGGLLAGEMLLGDLQNMERSFIETNYRTPEITQSFSMMQIGPAALLNLRQNASCSFAIPELCFDLFYPGQYCRKIKAVRLTIPCVAGPLTNIGATLTLTASKLRLKATDANPAPIMLTHSTVIATSTAQNDTGVFEFSFRDERYMPFEGAGAISSWKVELPDGFRQFDYQTITDVIVHISYTALQDDGLRQQVEKNNGTIATALKSQALGRLFSLRQEFPTVFNRLLHGALNTPVTMSVGANMLPFFIASSAIQVTKAALLLRTAASVTAVQGFAVSIDGTSLTSFQSDSVMANLPSADVMPIFAAGLFGDHALSVTNAGNLAPSRSQPGDVSPLDDSKLLDVMLYVEYQIGAT